MPKRWNVVEPSETVRLSTSGGEGGGGQSRKWTIEICLEDDDCTTLPWEWDSEQAARDAIEKGWKRAEVKKKKKDSVS